MFRVFGALGQVVARFLGDWRPSPLVSRLADVFSAALFSMTEKAWLECKDPWLLLSYVHDTASDRKFHLFVAACGRRVWHLLGDGRSRRAVEVVERLAEGRATLDEVQMAHDEAWAAVGDEDVWAETDPTNAWAAAVDAARRAVLPSQRALGRRLDHHAWEAHHDRLAVRALAAEAVCRAGGVLASLDDHTPLFEAAQADERAVQADLVRDLFGNPFRTMSFDPAWVAWRDGTVRRLAQAIYEGRRFDDLPILADALEEAGCDCGEMLAHCRSACDHVRGCWVVDLLLGRE